MRVVTFKAVTRAAQRLRKQASSQALATFLAAFGLLAGAQNAVGAVSASALGPASAQTQGRSDLFTLDLSGGTREASQVQRLKELRQQPTTQSVTVVRVNPSALGAAGARLVLRRDRAIELDQTKTERRSDVDYTWFGRATSAEGNAILVVHHGQVTGTVRDGLELYHVEPLGNGLHAVVRINQAGFPPEHPPSFKEIERHTPHEGWPSLAESAEMLRPEAAAQQIDVLVAYTPSARASVADIKATVNLAVAETNQSYVNSGVNIQLRLVDSFEHNYNEVGKDYGTILSDFANNATVQSRRNSSGADMSAMLINQAQYCGMAYILAQASNAYAIVHYSCATGYYSFGHELGHLQGARHDPVSDPSSSPFAYGHGYQQGNSWRTIMAYNCPAGCPRLQYWSNPNVWYQGLPMGNTSVSHNARVLNERAAAVASFRAPTWPDFVACASEGQTCSFSGTHTVAFGSGSKLVYRRLTNGTACTTAVFGDPAPGVAKTCFVGNDSYGQCAGENQTCSFSGTRNVAYGANGKFNYGTFTNGVLCSNSTFGDPIAGVVKACYTGPQAYVFCSAENQNCALPGVRSVAYGTDGRFAYRTLSGTFACNNVTFGDPAPGLGKACYVGPESYTYCAGEGGTCSVSGTRTVAYGANGTFIYKSLSGAVACNNTTFGDPMPGVGKACYVK